jgi:hypothetical protein
MAENALPLAAQPDSVQSLSHFRLAERRPALAHAVMVSLISPPAQRRASSLLVGCGQRSQHSGMSALREQELHQRVNSMTIDREAVGIDLIDTQLNRSGAAEYRARLEPSQPDTRLVGNGKLSRTDP